MKNNIREKFVHTESGVLLSDSQKEQQIRPRVFEVAFGNISLGGKLITADTEVSIVSLKGKWSSNALNVLTFFYAVKCYHFVLANAYILCRYS